MPSIRPLLCFLWIWIGCLAPCSPLGPHAAAAQDASALNPPPPEWLCQWKASLLSARAQLEQTRRTLQDLPLLQPNQPSPQLGYLHPRTATQPSSPPWIQVDLGDSFPLDAVVLLPAQTEWQAPEEPAHGFPNRLYIETSEDPEMRNATLLGQLENSQRPDPGIAPVRFPTRGIKGRFVRVTFAELARENGEFFCALSELIVLHGQRNVAAARPVTASATTEIANRWSLSFLTDSKSPLGPPIALHPLPYDGIYFGKPSEQEPAHAEIDLGQTLPIDEIRLHPIHAHIGSTEPGWAFPKRFKVELSQDPSFQNPIEISPFTEVICPNPGNSPVVLRTPHLNARHLRISLLEPYQGMESRFGLSEVEVFSGNKNVALGSKVTGSPDTLPASRNRPTNLLVDGFASSGKLLDLPQWLDACEKRRILDRSRDALARQIRSEEEALGRQWHLARTLLGSLLIATGLYQGFRLLRKTPAPKDRN